MDSRRLLSSFRCFLRGQGATEYLVILGAVLLVSLVVVSLTSASTSSQVSMKQQQSQAYWSSLSPIKVVSSKIVDANLVLGLQNTGTSTLRLDGVSIGSTNLPIYPYYSGDYYGPAYCSRPNDNFSEPSMTCSLLIGAGETAYVAAQGAGTIGCGGKTGIEISDVRFAYSLSSSGITNVLLKGDKPLVTSCGVKACDVNWVKVPGNSSLLVNDFCLMKYEAKCSRSDGGNGSIQCALTELPLAQSVNLPWVMINQTSAISRCIALGAGYHLILDREWVAVASNIASVVTNWNSSVVGSGCLYGGHMDNVPAGALAASTDDDVYNGTGNSATNVFACPFNNTGGGNKEQRRTMYLSNGEVVWDLSGNVWEWTDRTITSHACDGGMPKVNGLCPGFTNYTSITDFGSINYSRLPVITWNSTFGVGTVYLDPNTATDGGDVHAFIRGGPWANGADVGVWALNFNNAPSRAVTSIGFRCAR